MKSLFYPTGDTEVQKVKGAAAGHSTGRVGGGLSPSPHPPHLLMLMMCPSSTFRSLMDWKASRVQMLRASTFTCGPGWGAMRMCIFGPV